MGTQGVVSVVIDERVIVKAIAGCNGYEAPKLAAVIRERKLFKIEDVYQAALEVDFGCAEDLVVLSNTQVMFDGDVDGLGYLYRGTFTDPKFNPRWKNGTAAYTEVVELCDMPEEVEPVAESTEEV